MTLESSQTSHPEVAVLACQTPPQLVRLISTEGALHPKPTLGTGSVLSYSQNSGFYNMGSQAFASVPSVSVQDEDRIEDTLSAQMAKIKTSFNLSVSDLAIALQSSRPTIYAWLSGEQIPHSRNLGRIGELAKLSQVVVAPLQRKGAKMPVEGVTLINLLQVETIDHRKVQDHINQLSKSDSSQKGIFAEMAERKGVSFTVSEGKQDRLDSLTGKPAA